MKQVLVPGAVDPPKAESNTTQSSQGPPKLGTFCAFRSTAEWGPKFSTVIKVEALDGWVHFCDGKVFDTRVLPEVVKASSKSKDNRRGWAKQSRGRLEGLNTEINP
jgi:hypothetical protein